MALTRTLALAVFAVRALSAQIEPDALRILERVTRTHEALESYRAEMLSETKMSVAGRDVSTDGRVTMLFQKPRLMRTETEEPAQLQIISDGVTKWTYAPRLRQYTAKPAEEKSALSESFEYPRAFGAQMSSPAQNLSKARYLRRETIEIGGKRLDCDVLEAAYQQNEALEKFDMSPLTAWIDRASGLMVRMSLSMSPNGAMPARAQQTATFAYSDINVTIPAEAFTFTPPPGVELVAELDFRRGSREGLNTVANLGKPAPHFGLPTLEGGRISLEDSWGQVLLVNFWATWCGPCVAEMQALETVHRDLTGPGFTVLAINVGEDEETVRKFVEKHELTMPVALDGAQAAAGRFEVRAFPTTLVVDRKGAVVDGRIGALTEKEFREIVAKAGAGEKTVSGLPPRPAKLVTKVQPEYPKQARLAGLQGLAHLEAVVGPNGAPVNVEVTQSVGTSLDMAALEAVRQWRYEPAMIGGEPVDYPVRIRVPFRLGDEDEYLWVRRLRFRAPPEAAQPELIAGARAPFPEEARTAGFRGVTTLEFWIDEEGATYDLKLLNSTRDALDDAAKEAVNQWRFQPAMKDGRPVRARGYVEFTPPDPVDPDIEPIETESPYELYHAGMRRIEVRDYAYAVEHFTRALQYFADWKEAHNSRGRSYYSLRRYQEAVDDFTAALAVDPDYLSSLLQRGLAYTALKNHEAAIRDHTRYIELAPRNAFGYNNRGWAYHQKGDLAAARADYQRALELDEKHLRAWFNLGNLAIERAEYPDAIDSFTKYLELNPTNPHAYQRRALAREKMGDEAGAESDRAEAREIH